MIFDINIQPLRGYDKKQLLDEFIPFKANAVKGCNCTKNWIRAGRPLFGTKAFKQFCIEELIQKTKLTPGLGCYIEFEEGSKDTRLKPFNLIYPEYAKGIKKYILKYLISEVSLNKYKPKNDETDVIAIGLPIVSFSTLGEAKEAMKSLISETKKDYIIQTIKIPNNSISVIGRYTPASTAKEGTYIVFGIDFKHEKEKEYTLYNKKS